MVGTMNLHRLQTQCKRGNVGLDCNLGNKTCNDKCDC
jgi:hypothetical protein